MTCRPVETYADAHSVAALYPTLRDIVHTLQLRAPRPLVLVSGTRTPFQQWMLRHDRCPGRECDPACKGHPTTALPGKSHHENNGPNHCAADLGGPGLSWVHTVANDYAIHFPVPGEDWHIEPIPGRKPTVAIIPWAQPKPPKASVWVAIFDGNTDASLAAKGGFPHEVTEVQARLAAMAASVKDPSLDPHGADGIHGPNSQRAVNAFKRRVIAMQHAHGLPVWPNADSTVGQRTIDMLRFLNP